MLCLTLALPGLDTGLSQSSTPVPYTDATTGITFDTWSATTSQTTGGMTWGMVFPSTALSTDASEFIGILVRELKSCLEAL
jgi:cellobiose dehydrogenase (acceptor)